MYIHVVTKVKNLSDLHPANLLHQIPDKVFPCLACHSSPCILRVLPVPVSLCQSPGISFRENLIHSLWRAQVRRILPRLSERRRSGTPLQADQAFLSWRRRRGCPCHIVCWPSSITSSALSFDPSLDSNSLSTPFSSSSSH